MEAGASVWARDTKGEEAWLLCEVLKNDGNQLKLKEKKKPSNVFTRGVESSDEKTGERKFEGVELANTPLSQEEKDDGVDNDLITLPHLHEPAILHSLVDRFFRGSIYTWTGPVLIAVNPFERLPLYTEDILATYRRDGLLKSQGMQSGDELDPHIFAIADRSYRQMMGEKRKSQAILISGESGAGKTESTKIVMLYLTTLGSGQKEEPVLKEGEEKELNTMEKVLQSNPVLEAFGNARTLRNDNSSRFGKFIELGFNRAGHLMGAKVQTYLLEKVRLSFHAAGERNYHIFYQLLRGCPEKDHAKYEFHDGVTGGLDLPNYFHYTGQGGAPHLREFTDESGLEYTLKAMRKLGWAEETIDNVLSMMAGILHLGQIKFDSVDKDGVDAAVVADERSLEYASRLLGVDLEKLRAALTQRIVVARNQEITTFLVPDRAQEARDALSKTIYGSMFLWVVDQVNQSIGWKNDSDIRSSCGVLDIFGFECFAINSFEQLCINFTNEALQQQFNQFIFKLEQAEYSAEGIEWAFIEFPDNQDCLDTIQTPKTGILSMLDDECRLPKGSDKNFAMRLYKQYLPAAKQTVSENTRFQATSMQQAKSIFSVRHFAGLVEYRALTNWMEKNKDEIPITAQQLFDTAPNQLIKESYAIQKRENLGRALSEKEKQGGHKQKTVGQQFKEQLNGLIDNVQQTDPHYIRCIKPNDAAKPKLITRKRTTEQLRYGGVLEAVRVARAGYPVRLYHVAFFQRYRMLLPSTPDEVLPWSMEGREAQSLCVKLVDCVLAEGEKYAEKTKNGPLDPHEEGINRAEKIRRMQKQPVAMDFPKSDVQLGKTKVFMRKHPHDCLEAHRVFHQNATATLIQSWARGLEQERKYLVTEYSVQLIQRFYRGCKGRERWWTLRKAVAGMLFTKVFRMLIKWREFNRAKKGTIRYQALVRGYNARRVLAAIKVQKYYRKFITRKHYLMLKSATIALQCAARSRVARKVLFELQKEQKDVGKLKLNNEKLKQEMASLRAMLAAQAKGAEADAEHEAELAVKEEQIKELEARVTEIEKELDAAKKLVEDLEAEVVQQKKLSAQDKEQINKLQHVRRYDAPVQQQAHTRTVSEGTPIAGGMPSNYVSPEVVNQHRAHVARLEEKLENERQLRREADGEIIKLRAAINGVKLDEGMVSALLSPQEEGAQSLKSGATSEESSLVGDEKPSSKEIKRSESVEKALSTLGVGKEEEPEEKPSFLSSFKASAELIPMIKRGFTQKEEEEKEDVVAVGWKVEVRNRKDREELLRDDVHRFESRLKKSLPFLEEGVEVVMWQLNKGSPDVTGRESTDEFALKSSNVTIKLHRRGQLLVQSVLTFIIRGGYLSKAMGRNRPVNKTALEPLSLHDILEVRAGCSGFDHTELPSASKSKGKKSSKSSGNEQASLFMTLKATPTPVAASRSYIFRFKSRSSRNEMVNSMRAVLADMQIHEGVNVSNIHSENDINEAEREEILVPLSAVHEVINKERENYDRILLMLLQGGEDLKEKEDELLGLRNKLGAVVTESKEKDRVQANDSKLIMQLSKKLETLLMDNEDLRDQNDRLNNRLVAVESEKMNILARQE